MDLHEVRQVIEHKLPVGLVLRAQGIVPLTITYHAWGKRDGWVHVRDASKWSQNAQIHIRAVSGGWVAEASAWRDHRSGLAAPCDEAHLAAAAKIASKICDWLPAPKLQTEVPDGELFEILDEVANGQG